MSVLNQLFSILFVLISFLVKTNIELINFGNLVFFNFSQMHQSMNFKIVLFSFILAFSSKLSYSQDFISLGNNLGDKTNLLFDNGDSIVLEFNFSGYRLIDIPTLSGIKKAVQIPETARSLVAGAPEVLQRTESVIIPHGSTMQLAILESEFIELANTELIPSKGNLMRTIDPASVPYQQGSEYQQKGFYPAEVSNLSKPYILRDFSGQAISVFPVQYNHSQKLIRIYRKIRVSLSKSKSSNSPKAITKFTKPIVNRSFIGLYQNHFVNFGPMNYIATSEKGKMLIIADTNFMAAMIPFVQWKNLSGIPTEMVSTATTGTSASSIKTYITNYYNTENLSFLLLVGDAQHVPPITSGVSGESDNAYAYISGNDHYPEFYVGRFSVETVADVNTMVSRTLTYEKNPPMNNSWLKTNMGIASSQGPGDDNEMDYEHIRNIQIDLAGYTYSTDYELFDGSQGGQDAAGNPTSTMVLNLLNEGVGHISYCGHGSSTSWGSSNFNNSGINNASNNDAWPTIFSVACVNGDFVGKTCFAETWLRARSSNNEPEGAIAVIMSTINQSWDPPMEGQDEMIDVMCELDTANIKHSFGAIVMSGCMQMNDSYGSSGDNMTDTWTVFGDPSVVVRTDSAVQFAVNHDLTRFLGDSVLNVSSTANGAYVSLTKNYQVIATGVIQNNSCILTFSPLSTLDSLIIVVTKYNHLPYIDTIPVLSNQGPIVQFSSFQIDDYQGNNNQQADFGETFWINVALSNSGLDTASNISAVLKCYDPKVQINDSLGYLQTLAPGTINSLTGAFNISLNGYIPNGYVVPLSLHYTDGIQSQTAAINLTVNAPELISDSISIDDSDILNNNNGIFDPGEKIILGLWVRNIGLADYTQLSGSCTINHPQFSFTNHSYQVSSLNAGQWTLFTFQLSCDAAVPVGTRVTVNFSVGDSIYEITEDYQLTLGIATEDFETGDFQLFPWINAGNIGWQITNQNSYEGQFSAKSGDISHNQQSILNLDVAIHTADSISFYRKVSCQDNQGSLTDYFSFSIDNQIQEIFKGEMDWERVAYPITAGTHQLKWTFIKNDSVSLGADAAWVDFIVLPALSTIIAPSPTLTTSSYVFPNPASTDFQLKLNAPMQDEVRISMWDATGKIVLNPQVLPIHAGENTIDIQIDKQEYGIYYLQIIGNTIHKTHRVVLIK